MSVHLLPSGLQGAEVFLDDKDAKQRKQKVVIKFKLMNKKIRASLRKKG